MNLKIELPYRQEGRLVIGYQGKWMPNGFLQIDKDSISCQITALLDQKKITVPISSVHFIKVGMSMSFSSLGTKNSIEIVAKNQQYIKFAAENAEIDELISVLSSLGIKIYNSESEIPKDQKHLMKRDQSLKIVLIIFGILFIGFPILSMLALFIAGIFR